MRFMSFAGEIEVPGRSERVGALEQLHRSGTATGVVATASLSVQKLELGGARAELPIASKRKRDVDMSHSAWRVIGLIVSSIALMSVSAFAAADPVSAVATSPSPITETSVSHSSYSCPEGGTLVGAMCELTASSEATSTTSYTCATGTLDGAMCDVSATTYAATSKATYTCATGTLSGETCTVAPSNYAATYEQTGSYPEYNYSCPSGGAVDGATCDIAASSYPEVWTSTACIGEHDESVAPGDSCPTGDGSGIEEFSCPSGGTPVGDICDVAASSYDATPEYSGVGADYGYVCNGNDTLNSQTETCTSSGSTSTATANTAYVCKGSDTLNSQTDTCTTPGTTSAATPSSSYSCPNGGSIGGTLCDLVTTYAATMEPESGGGSSGGGSGNSTYSASATATDGTVFSAVSSVSQAAAQAAANALAAAYNVAHGGAVLSVSATSASVKAGSTPAVRVTVSGAPPGQTGAVIAVLGGPVAVPSGGTCASLSPSAFTAFAAPATGAISGDNTLTVAAANPTYVAGCYTWQVSAVFSAGSIAEATSSPIFTVTPSVSFGPPVARDEVTAPLAGVHAVLHAVTSPALALAQSASSATVSAWNLAALTAHRGTVVVAGHVLTEGAAKGPLFNVAELKKGGRVYVTTASGALTTWSVTDVLEVTYAYGVPSSVFTGAGPSRLVLASCTGTYDAETHHWTKVVIVTASEVTS
jgi:Sortase domain